MSVLLVLALAGATLDEVPLLAPRFPADPADKAVVTYPPRAPIGPEADVFVPAIAEKHLHVGVKALGDLHSTGLLFGGAVAAIELGGRLPWWRARLGLMLEPAVGGIWGSGSRALWVHGGALLTWHERLGNGLLRVAAGPSVIWIDATTAAGGAVYNDAFLTFGATAGVGYIVPLGPGGVVMELRYLLLPQVIANTPMLGHGVNVGVGYSFFVL